MFICRWRFNFYAYACDIGNFDAPFLLECDDFYQRVRDSRGLLDSISIFICLFILHPEFA